MAFLAGGGLGESVVGKDSSSEESFHILVDSL